MELDQALMISELDASEQSEAAFMSDYIFALDHQYPAYQHHQHKVLPRESPDAADDDALLIPQYWTDIHQLECFATDGLGRDHDGIHLNDHEDALEAELRLMSSIINDPPDHHIPLITKYAESIDSSKSRSSARTRYGDQVSSIDVLASHIDDDPGLLRPPVIIDSVILRKFLIKKRPLGAVPAAAGGSDSAAAADSTNHAANHMIDHDKHHARNYSKHDDNLRAANADGDHANTKQASIINGARKMKQFKSKRNVQNMAKESLRRKQLTSLFHTLRDLLPNKPFQNDRCMIVDEAVRHILSLERHRKIYAQVLRSLRRPRRCHNASSSSSTSLRTVLSSSSSSTSPSSVAGVRYDDDDVLAPSVRISLVNCNNKDSKNMTSLSAVQISIVCPTFLISDNSASHTYNSASSACLGNHISRRRPPSLLGKFMSLLERRGFAIDDATFSLGQQSSFYSFRARSLSQESLPSSISIDSPAFLDNLEDDLILTVASTSQQAAFLNLL